MTLHVTFDQFAETVQRVLDSKDAYVEPHGNGCLVTAAVGEKGVVVMSRVHYGQTSVRAKLEQAGMKVFDGAWLADGDSSVLTEETGEAYVAAVAYKSGESMPGVWVDAYLSHPTQVQVLRAMYDEFRETGEMPDVSFEEFVRLSEPNVVVVPPTSLQSFLDKKSD